MGKKAGFIVFSSNPLDKITNSKDIESVYVNGHDVDRLEMVRKIKVGPVTISQQDRNQEAELQKLEQEAAEDRNLKKYGKFALGPTMNVTAGLTVQTPKRSKTTPSSGPPYRIIVQLARASGAELREFYTKVLPEARWAVNGDCFEKPNPAQEGKRWKICTEPGQGQIILNISVQ